MSQKNKLRRVRFTRQFSAPRAKVFALFASHERFGAALAGPVGEKIGTIKRIQVSPDPAHPDGVGSVRRIGFGPTAFEETVVTCQQDSLIEYVISKGSPVRNHRGHIVFRDIPGGTQVDYEVSYEPRIPGTGTAIAIVLHTLISTGLDRIENEFGAL